MLILVSVQKYHIFLPIGWYEEEIKVKTEVFIDVEIQYETSQVHDDLNNTIDYAEIHRLLKQLSVSSYRLLESFGEVFIKQISQRYSHLDVKFIIIRIHKPQILERNSSCEAQFVEMRMDF
jgi:dihydroneopterin aldolase